jgi:lipoprotein-releasing system permease protein
MQRFIFLPKSRPLNFELFIARRLFRRGKGTFTRPIINISVASVALGITVLILAVAILKGFQQEIREKIIGFGAHIQVTWFDNNASWEVDPIRYDTAMVEQIRAIPGVVHVQPFGLKAGIIKTDDQIEGIVVKGVGPAYDWSFFASKLVEGALPKLDTAERSTETLISRNTAARLGFSVGDKVILYFIQDPPRFRSFTVSGIYETGLADFDDTYLFADIRHIARLNNWEPDQISGLEVLIADFTRLEEITLRVNETIPPDQIAESIRDLHPQLFGWLALMDQNVIIILIITILVALIHMTSALLIMIIERTNMIGVLKALGMTNLKLRKLFLMQGALLLLKGIIIGNAIAVSIAVIQQKTGLLKLDQESYYLDKVPVSLQTPDILLVNAGVIVICILVMIIPSYIIGKITPIRAIRFD